MFINVFLAVTVQKSWRGYRERAKYHRIRSAGTTEAQIKQTQRQKYGLLLNVIPSLSMLSYCYPIMVERGQRSQESQAS